MLGARRRWARPLETRRHPHVRCVARRGFPDHGAICGPGQHRVRRRVLTDRRPTDDRLEHPEPGQGGTLLGLLPARELTPAGNRGSRRYGPRSRVGCEPAPCRQSANEYIKEARNVQFHSSLVVGTEQELR